MKKFRLSPSSLSLFRDCHRCFWLSQHGKWKRPSGPFPSLPSGVDRVLKEYFSSCAKKGVLPKELSGKEFSGVKVYGDEKQLSVWQDTWKGLSFTSKEGHTLRGAIDALLVKDNRFIVVDFKTKGAAPSKDADKYYRDQLNLYSFLFRKNGFSCFDVSYLLFYHPVKVDESGGFVFHVTKRRVRTSLGDAEKLFSDAIRVLEGSCPKRSCDWCRFVPQQQTLF